VARDSKGEHLLSLATITLDHDSPGLNLGHLPESFSLLRRPRPLAFPPGFEWLRASAVLEFSFLYLSPLRVCQVRWCLLTGCVLYSYEHMGQLPGMGAPFSRGWDLAGVTK
jgi:hypothetical protein